MCCHRSRLRSTFNKEEGSTFFQFLLKHKQKNKKERNEPKIRKQKHLSGLLLNSFVFKQPEIAAEYLKLLCSNVYENFYATKYNFVQLCV